MRTITLALTLLFLTNFSLTSIDFSNRINKGIIEYTELDENSGMVVGIENPDIIWAVNDGKANEVYGFDKSGNKIAVLEFDKDLLKEDSDIEDIAISIINGISYIILADIGDNDNMRDNCYIYLIPEPISKNIKNEVKIKKKDIQIIRLEYEDGARDAECCLSDPTNNNIYIISKRDKNARLYELEYPFTEEKVNKLEYNGSFEFGNNLSKGYTGVNGGDISKDGKYILIRDYSNVWYFEKESSESFTSIISKPLQRVGAYNYSLNEEPQGESICWDKDNSGFFTASEEKQIDDFDASLFYFKSLLSGVKKKELNISIINTVVTNHNNTKVNLIFYNYIGIRLQSIILFPNESYDFNQLKNQAHYLIINNYKQLFKLY